MGARGSPSTNRVNLIQPGLGGGRGEGVRVLPLKIHDILDMKANTNKLGDFS